jgi:hypothetical protein
MEKKHGGVLMLQELEPRRLIGALMSVMTETGEDWIHLSFSNEAGVFEITDDGGETKLVLTRSLSLSLVALLRVALAQFDLLHARTVLRDVQPEDGMKVRAEASRRSVLIAWPSGADGVQRRNADEQVQLELRAVVGAAIEKALVASLAGLAVGAPAST